MKAGTKTLILLGFLVSSYVIGLLIFTKGFLLVRTMIHKNSSCDVDFSAGADDLVHVGPGHRGCWSHARFKKAIVIIIDALRYDFLVYNSSLKLNVPAYKNKLKTINNILSRNPQNARLYKFMADPPTTTLQRLKGLTTGSLPTFVDAGANFDSSEITEDNWVDQLNLQDKTVKFLGDDTWDSLFPNRFHKAFPFPSFNVKDLHTVDDGILKHIYSELRKKDWDVLIAHFLGVDHCGHRFGPNHPAMAEKLEQMDHVIRNVSRVMKEDTVLFVLGDHGMTRTGDHGGDSDDELSAGLFVYSPVHITASSPPPQDTEVVIQQIDLVPTISLLLGLPIPFSNLGTVIPDLFNHCPWWDTKHNEIRQVFHTVKALHLNALQVSQYLTAYAEKSSDFPAEKFQRLEMMLKQCEQGLQSLVTGVVSGTGTPGLHEQLKTLRDKYKDYLAQVRSMCQQVWAKFDLTAMSLGIGIIVSTVLLNLLLAVFWVGEEEALPAYFPFLMGGVVLQIVYYIVHVSVFPPSVPPVMGFVLSLVLVYAVLVILKKQVCGAWQDCKSTVVESALATFVLLMYFAAYFSNSFVVYEDSFTHFLAQSLLWLVAFRIMMRCRSSVEGGKDANTSRLSKKPKQSSLFDIMEILTQPALVTFIITAICSFLLRCSINFRACREEQWDCEVSTFLQPLSYFTEGDTGYKNQRYFFSVIVFCLTIWAVQRWLQYYGNLNGDGINILCTKFLVPLGVIACVLYWAVQALPPKDLDALPPWQQTIMARIVYGCVIIHLAVTLLRPLYVYIYHPTATSVTVPLLNRRPQHAVPHVYRQLQQHWNKTDETDHTPAAYGLGSVYSSSVVAFATSWILLLVLLLGDGVSPSLILAVWILFIFLEMMTALCSDATSSSGSVEKAVPWITVVMLGVLSSVFFCATGHQATISSIRFESAFTGFYGDFSTNIIPAFLITLNTFAAPILLTMVSPLLLFWPHLRGAVSGWMVASRGPREGDHWKGDFALYDNGVLLRKNLFISSCRLLLFHAVKVLGATCAAAMHRRHLMVWKIFAPRFVFEGASFIIVSVVLLLMTLYVLHVDRCVSRLTRSLHKLS